VYLELSDEQGFLVEAASGVLGRLDTLAMARAALDGDPAPALWHVAVEAGWPGLLLAEDADGAELGAYEAMLVLEACGAALADARLLGHLPATALIELERSDPGLRRALASGERRAALVDGVLSGNGSRVSARVEGEIVVFDGAVSAVLDAPGADALVIAGSSSEGDVAGVIDVDDGAVDVGPQQAYDATRSLAVVTLDGARARRLEIPPERVADGRNLQRALLAAESVGAADACLTMAREYAIDRHAFGRAIGSYQAIKHKLVEMLRRIEGARSLLVHAGREWEHDRPAFPLAANAARVAAADALDYAAPENIFIHGGIGATWEHDAQLYYRRAELSRRLGGGADAAADAVAEELFASAPVR
jgi:alkylation response protein AidB-like acyl-CoA dehydrogenase